MEEIIASNVVELPLSDGIAILALIVSIYAVWSQKNVSRSINETNLEKGFFEQIFELRLREKIPLILTTLNYKKEFVVQLEMLSEILTDMLLDAVFYKHFDSNFYKKLENQIEIIDDYIMESISTSEIINENQIKQEINKKIGELYKIIKKHYFTIK